MILFYRCRALWHGQNTSVICLQILHCICIVCMNLIWSLVKLIRPLIPYPYLHDYLHDIFLNLFLCSYINPESSPNMMRCCSHRSTFKELHWWPKFSKHFSQLKSFNIYWDSPCEWAVAFCYVFYRCARKNALKVPNFLHKSKFGFIMV